MERMTERQIETLQIADAIIDRAKRPATEFRRIHGPREEVALINACEFWRNQASRLSAAILEKQKISMSAGEPE